MTQSLNHPMPWGWLLPSFSDKETEGQREPSHTVRWATEFKLRPMTPVQCSVVLPAPCGEAGKNHAWARAGAWESRLGGQRACCLHTVSPGWLPPQTQLPSSVPLPRNPQGSPLGPKSSTLLPAQPGPVVRSNRGVTSGRGAHSHLHILPNSQLPR